MSADLRPLMERILALHAEEDEIKSDRKEVYAEAQTAGFNKSALGLAIRTIRARQKAETPSALEKQSEAERMVEEYDRLAHVHVREATYPEIAPPETSTAAQSEGAAGSIPEQEAPDSAAGDGELAHSAQGAAFAMPSGAGEEGTGTLVSADPAPAADAKPRFTLPPAKALRPNCLKPEACAGVGARHCFTCTQAANAREPALEEA